jgi:O-antigen/teichoic acid export membrane protein
MKGLMSLTETVRHRPQPTGKRAFIEHYVPTLFGQGLILGMGILTGILSARILGPEGRGQYVAVIIWPMGIVTLLSCGMNQAIAFNVGRNAFTVSEVATAVTAIGLIQGLLSVSIGLVIIHFVLASYPLIIQHLGMLFVLLTPVLILSGYPANVFQGLQHSLRFNLIRVLPQFVYAGGLVGLYFTHRASLTSVIVFQLAGYVAALGLGVTMIWVVLKPRLRWDPSAVPRLIDFGYRTQATNLTSYFNQRIDQLALSLLVPPRQLGLYAVAVTLSTAVTVFPQAAGIVTFSRASSQLSQDAKDTIGVSFRASLLWLLVCSSVLYPLAPFLIRLVFGAAFDGSILACRILLPGALMIGLNQVLYNGASALGRPGLPSCAEGVSMALTGIGLYVLVPRYGYIGAAIVSSIAYTTSFLLMLVLTHKVLGISLRILLVGGRCNGEAGP